jgi:hypothetical protein
MSSLEINNNNFHEGRASLLIGISDLKNVINGVNVACVWESYYCNVDLNRINPKRQL